MGCPDKGECVVKVCKEEEDETRENGVTVFSYSEKDVKQCVHKQTGWTRANYSEFDHLLCTHWDEATSNGIFRYTLDDVSTRPLPGRCGFVVQRNPKRFSHRRKPADMSSITQPFNPDQFNFNKINKKEILLEVRRESTCGDNEKHHWLVVNVSPIDYGHVLLVPEPQSCLPQIMTQDSIQLCLDIVAMSNHSGFCMVANSLLAYASVNHLHYHFLYISHPLPAAKVTGRPLTRTCYELVNHFSSGFGFELKSSTADCAQEIFKVVSLLVECNIPHNLIMLRGDPFIQDSSVSNPETVVRTLLIARKPAYGLKNVYESDLAPPFFAAACELGLGFIPVVDQSKYDTLTEEDVLELLNKHILSQAEFSALRTNAKERLVSQQMT